MDTLVMVSTSFAYFFSVGIMIAIVALDSLKKDAVLNEVFFSSR